MMATRGDKHHFATITLIFSVFLVLILGCGLPSGKSSVMVRSGCVTPDGSKIALIGVQEMASAYANPTADELRVILDGNSGKITWKDTGSKDPLACAPDNSIVSISDTGAKWIGSEKEIVFGRKGKGLQTSFIGMTDKSTIIREDREYYTERMPGSGGTTRNSSVRSFKILPTLLIDRVGETGTRAIELSESDLGPESKSKSFNYYLEKDRVILYAGQKLYATDLKSGTTRALEETYMEMQSRLAVTDRYGAIEKEGYTADGAIEIYDGAGESAKLVNKINKRDLNAKVISLIDCCNNGLLMLYWERGTYVRVAKIDHLSGEVKWRSDSLLMDGQK